jgi:uncharacterized protein YecT (DUF1311 family)
MFVLVSLCCGVVPINAQTDQGDASSSSDPCADETIVENMRDCVAQKLDKADRILNETYKAVMASLPPDKKIQVRDAEREWIKRTKIECVADAKELEGGSEWQIEYDSCYLNATEAQTKKLRKFAP